MYGQGAERLDRCPGRARSKTSPEEQFLRRRRTFAAEGGPSGVSQGPFEENGEVCGANGNANPCAPRMCIAMLRPGTSRVYLEPVSESPTVFVASFSCLFVVYVLKRTPIPWCPRRPSTARLFEPPDQARRQPGAPQWCPEAGSKLHEGPTCAAIFSPEKTPFAVFLGRIKRPVRFFTHKEASNRE